MYKFIWVLWLIVSVMSVVNAETRVNGDFYVIIFGSAIIATGCSFVWYVLSFIGNIFNNASVVMNEKAKNIQNNKK